MPTAKLTKILQSSSHERVFIWIRIVEINERTWQVRGKSASPQNDGLYKQWR